MASERIIDVCLSVMFVVCLYDSLSVCLFANLNLSSKLWSFRDTVLVFGMGSLGQALSIDIEIDHAGLCDHGWQKTRFWHNVGDHWPRFWHNNCSSLMENFFYCMLNLIVPSVIKPFQISFYHIASVVPTFGFPYISLVCYLVKLNFFLK